MSKGARKMGPNHLSALNGLHDGDPAAVRAAIENDIRSSDRRLLAHITRA